MITDGNAAGAHRNWTRNGAERVLREKNRWRLVAILTSTVGALLPLVISGVMGVFILGENARAENRWRTEPFRQAVDSRIRESFESPMAERKVSEIVGNSALAAGADVASLQQQIKELEDRLAERDKKQSEEIQSLQRTVDRLVGQLDAYMATPRRWGRGNENGSGRDR